MAQSCSCKNKNGQQAQEQPQAYRQEISVVPCPVGQQKSSPKSSPKEETVESSKKSAKPCTKLSPSLDDGVILNVAPCRKIQDQIILGKTLDVMPFTPQPEELDAKARRLEKRRKREELFESLLATAFDIISPDYKNPELNNSQLDDCILLSYADDGPWEKMVDLSAKLLGDVPISCDFQGILDEDYSDDEEDVKGNNDQNQNQNTTNTTSNNVRTMCTDDPSKV